VRQYDHPAPETLVMTEVLRALSDPLRLAIVRRLDREGAQTCAALIGERPKSSMSHHFQVLRDAGVIHTRIEGVTHYNTVRRDVLDTRFPGLMDAILSARAD
jgi:DNA-binding transcriptional ArsR family regulator